MLDTILIATANQGKIKELGVLLEQLHIKVKTLNDFKEIFSEPEETGKTFFENALLKAKYYSEQTGYDALADDSGLEIIALNGAPGIYSARYGGEMSELERSELILSELSDIKDRRAVFVCVLALYIPEQGVRYFRGTCLGTIAYELRGNNGFGYDPIFIPQGYDKTFAELPDEIKGMISHRANAIKNFREFLCQVK